MGGTDSLTILRSRGRRLAKLIRQGGGVQGYDSAKHYDMHAVMGLHASGDAGALSVSYGTQA